MFENPMVDKIVFAASTSAADLKRVLQNTEGRTHNCFNFKLKTATQILKCGMTVAGVPG